MDIYGQGIDREHIPFNDKIAESFAHEGEQFISRGFVKTQGFEETIAFVMSLTQQVWQIAQQHKSFRMELHYNAGTLNVNYCFFRPTDKFVSDGIHPECPDNPD